MVTVTPRSGTPDWSYTYPNRLPTFWARAVRTCVPGSPRAIVSNRTASETLSFRMVVTFMFITGGR